MKRIELVLFLVLISAVMPLAAQPSQKGDEENGFTLVEGKGLVITGIVKDSPAEKAGIERGDILLAVDGTDITSEGDIIEILKYHKAGDVLKLRILHGEETKNISLKIEERLYHPPLGMIFARGSMTFSPRLFLDRFPESLENLRDLKDFRGRTEDLKDWFGSEFYTNGKGALVTEVNEGGPAEQAGIQEGDIILSVGKTEISTKMTLSKAVASHKPGDKVVIKLMRREEDETIEVPVTLAETAEGTALLGLKYAVPIRNQMFRIPDLRIPPRGPEGRPPMQLDRPRRNL